MPTLKIRTQIVLPFLLLMLILGVVGTYLTTSLVATSLENRIADQLVHSEDAALDAAVKLQGRQVAAIRLIANTEGVDRAVRSGDVAALRQLIVPLEVNNRLGTVMVFDASGHTILEIRQPDASSPSSSPRLTSSRVVRSPRATAWVPRTSASIGRVSRIASRYPIKSRISTTPAKSAVIWKADCSPASMTLCREMATAR